MGWIVPFVPIVAAVLAAGRACAADPLVLRARGFVRGRAEIAPARIRCEVPTPTSAIPDSTFVLGLRSTAGVPTLAFPDQQNPYADPCGGWLRVESALGAQGVQLARVELRYRLAHARRLEPAVPVRQGFPVACRPLRRAALAVGLRLDPAGTGERAEGGTGFVPVLPMVSPDLLACLRSALASLPDAAFALLVRARVAGVADSGDRITSNETGYTLTLIAEPTPLPDAPPSG